jgi:hypothetical protein
VCGERIEHRTGCGARGAHLWRCGWLGLGAGGQEGEAEFYAAGAGDGKGLDRLDTQRRVRLGKDVQGEVDRLLARELVSVRRIVFLRVVSSVRVVRVVRVVSCDDCIVAAKWVGAGYPELEFHVPEHVDAEAFVPHRLAGLCTSTPHDTIRNRTTRHDTRHTQLSGTNKRAEPKRTKMAATTPKRKRR